MELLSFIFSTILGWLGVHGGRKAAARDLFFETLTNAERSLSAASTGMAQKFAVSAWQAHRPVLARMKAEGFNKIRTAYASAEHLEGFEAKWWSDKRMRETIARLGLEFVLAARALEPKALGRTERREFNQKLTGLEHRLETSRDLNSRSD